MELRIINKLLLSLIAIPCLAWAASSDFVIQDIRVEGLQRVDPGTVYNDLPVKIGDTFYSDESPAIIRQLFKSGSFSNITLARDGNTLVVIVHERPTIGQLEIVGNEAIKTEDMMEGLRAVGVGEGLTYVPSVLEQVKQELLQQYYAYGQYGVDIELEVEDLPRNRVGITINIEEGAPAKIRNINIVGNQAFTTRQLLKQFTLTTPGLMTWFNKNDQYSKVKLTGDLEKLRSFYQDRGYLKFEITSTQVSIVPNKEDIYLTINIHEGDQYTVSAIEFGGELIGSEEDYRKLVTQKVGDLFSRRKVTQSQKRLVDSMGQEGYAFAEVNPVPTLHEDTKTVTLTFYMNPKKQVYVRHINFAGNYLSKDEVLRRSMRQLEGSLSSTRKIDRSRNNLNLLGYFKDVNIETVPVPGTDDQIDLDVHVTEELSGQLTGGVGYSQVDGVLFNIAVKQDNFLGSGNMVDFLFNRSRAFTSYKLGFNDPYYTMDGVSRGFDLFYMATDTGEQEITNYTRDLWGGGLQYGIPVSEVDRLNAGIGYENVFIKTSNNPFSVSEQVEEFVIENGHRFNLYRLSASWSHNTLNRATFPSDGLLQSISGSITVPLSDLEYYKLLSMTRYYYPLSSEFTLLLRGNVAWGNGYGNTSQFPIYENYYAGGSGSVRGFNDNSLGPEDSMGDPLGGNFRFVASTEIYFPVPFVEIESVRTSVFIDAGNVYNTPIENINLGTLRYSAGLSLQWLSPMGPFVFSVAKPLTNYEGDVSEIFQFNIGSTY
jgi:outer membrane protein insertion porin family